MEGPRVVFLIVLLLFIFLTPDQPAKRRVRLIQESVEQRRHQELDILTNSTYGQLNPKAGSWLNLTGFREDDKYAWEELSAAQSESRKQFDLAWGGIDANHGLPIYENIDGELRGRWSRRESDGPFPPINLTAVNPRLEYMSHWFDRNVTESEGEISLSILDARKIGENEAVPIRADIAIFAKSAPGNGWNARLRGVHFPSGQVVMSTWSSKFNAYPALPHFALNERDFNASIPIMNDTVHKMWDSLFDDPDNGLAFAPQCELIIWLQPFPIKYDGFDPGQTANYIHEVEKELLHPDGAPIGQPPQLSFAAVIFSPDCGYMLGSSDIVGPKIETYWTLAQRLILAFAMVLGLQIALLKRQMEKAATPSTRSRVAYQSIVIAALGDGLILFALIALLMIHEAAFLIVAAATFFACIHVAFLEVKFVFDIWTVQVGEPARAEHERRRRAATTAQAASAATAPAPAPATNPTPGPGTAPEPTATVGRPLDPRTADAVAAVFFADTLPPPVTAPRPTDGATPVPVILPSDQDALTMGPPPSPRASFAAIYSRFYFSLVMLMFFSLWAMSWPRPLRSAYANTLIFAYFSFWWPQIYRNIMRNCRKALSWEYVLGTSTLRAVPILYWYFADGNILNIDTSPSQAFMLLGWLWLQVAVLLSQHFLGPRLLVRESWCPPAYDYHPVLREDDVEANGMSIGLLASASEAKDKDDKTRKVFDCAICMNEIDVPVVSSADGQAVKGATWLEQKDYMVTPCRHIFHAECLEGWMNLRLVCPVCREALPPL